MKAKFKKFIGDERGIETVEYAVMTALIVASLATAIGSIVMVMSDSLVDTAAVLVDGTIVFNK